MKSRGIYKIENIKTGESYVGSAINIERRWYIHKHTLRNNCHHNLHLQRAWNKYGEENFKFIILENVDKEELINREQFYFELLKPEYIMCKKAYSRLGTKHSEATKKKFSDIAKRRNHSPFKGMKHSKESLQKMSQSLKGRISPNKGKHLSKKTKQKISEGKQGKHLNKETKLKMRKHSQDFIDKIKNEYNTSRSTFKKLSKMFDVSPSFIWTIIRKRVD